MSYIYVSHTFNIILVTYLQAEAQKVKSYNKDTNHFLNKTKSLGKLTPGAILCTIDVVGLYHYTLQKSDFSLKIFGIKGK